MKHQLTSNQTSLNHPVTVIKPPFKHQPTIMNQLIMETIMNNHFNHHELTVTNHQLTIVHHQCTNQTCALFSARERTDPKGWTGLPSIAAELRTAALESRGDPRDPTNHPRLHPRVHDGILVVDDGS